MPPQAPIAGARPNEQLGDGFGQFAIERQIDFAIPIGQPSSCPLFADELNLGVLQGLAILAQCPDRHRKTRAERVHRCNHLGRLR